METSYKTLPAVALRGLTILPEMVKHFDVSREKSVRAVESAMEAGQQVFLVTQRDIAEMDPGAEDVYTYGCIATIRQVVKMPKKISRVLVVGEMRAKLQELKTDSEYLEAVVLPVPDEDMTEEKGQVEDLMISQAGMVAELKEVFALLLARDPKLNKEIGVMFQNTNNLGKLVNLVAAHVPMDYTYAQKVLEASKLEERYMLVLERTVDEVRVSTVKEEIQKKLKERVDKSQREYILREELKLIREELGDDKTISDADEFQEKCESLEASEEIKKKIAKEIRRFRNTMGSPSELAVIRTYLETMLDMPWDKMCEEQQDIAYARKVLDEDHYGLEKVKERVLESLAVRLLTQKGESPILCLVGPPGTGKTSIARSLARALAKPYVRISLGGVRDEAEIRGHRKTYIGAMPGRIAEAVRQAGVKNPLILLDEIDKVSNDYKGDTFSALLEVLDSEQNRTFRDHYLEVPLDLSEVLFVTTANSLQTIPRPLLDRMEVIEVNSYTENEKLHIAMDHLLPKQLKKNGLSDYQVKISKGAVFKLAHNYTREAGVRQLERKIGDICRKCAREILEEKKTKLSVTERNLKHYLGKEIYSFQKVNEEDQVGIVRGLAWTSVGGDTLEIEVNVLPGKGEISLTGQLGDVMKESARAGISYIRSVADRYEIDEDFFQKHDIHVHIPEGAVPKDGPSAGNTMTTAMLSAITGRKVKADLAMTGEVTLRGRVLPIGGLKEKLLAAKNAGITNILVPKKNMIDVEELSKEITGELNIVPVVHMDEVIRNAFV